MGRPAAWAAASSGEDGLPSREFEGYSTAVSDDVRGERDIPGDSGEILGDSRMTSAVDAYYRVFVRTGPEVKGLL